MSPKHAWRTAAFAAFCATVLAGLALVTAPHARAGATATCTLDPIRLDVHRDVASFSGRCTAGAAAVLSRFSYRYRTYDELGHGCGRHATRGLGKRVVLQPRGAARVVIDATISAAGAVARGHVEAKLAAGRAVCAPWTQVPRSTICAWSDKTTTNCGTWSSAPYCTWTSPPRLIGHVVSMGRFGCEARSCSVATPRSPQPRARLWLGSLVRFEYWRCADTTYAVPRLSSLRLVGLSKRSCRAKLPFDTVNPLSSFALPSAPDGRPRWGGDLYVAWTLDQYGPGSRPLQGWETETAVLHLSGRADGCPELTGR